MQILHTRKLEETARELARRYQRVLVRNKNALWHPIRMRRARLQDLKPYIVMAGEGFDAELAAWNRDGGLLIYDRGYMRTENIASHHAQLISECPLSMEDLYTFVDGTRELAVIYRPPSWDMHFHCVEEIHPTAERARSFHALVEAAPAREDLVRVLGLAPGFRALADEHAMVELELNGTQIWKIREALFRKRDYKMVTQVVPRVPPPDRALAEVYAFIVQHAPQAAGGVRLLLGSALSKATRYWKMALRDLARHGSIEMRDTIFCYYLERDFEPHWFKVDAEHQRARARLEEIIAYVEELPELIPPPDETRPRSPSHSSALSRLKSGA